MNGGLLDYNPGNQRFTITSDDVSLVDEFRDYGLTAQLAEYASTFTPVVVSAQIEFNNPCKNPFEFSAEE